MMPGKKSLITWEAINIDYNENENDDYVDKNILLWQWQC